MLDKKYYSNGQKIFELASDRLTYFFKSGNIKAEGLFVIGKMEGEWKFYRETGQLCQIGKFKNSKKNGSWIRYDKNDKIEYNEYFENDKVIKRK